MGYRLRLCGGGGEGAKVAVVLWGRGGAMLKRELESAPG